MNKSEIRRLEIIEKRVRELAEEFGLLTTDILFEIVPSQRMLEGMAYGFPANFSHWSFGRDYEKMRTIYDHSGAGIPYEVVWNFDIPRAFVVETNPFALNALIVAHVYGHVDFFLASRYCQHGRSFSDIAEEARNAAQRFREYEAKYGKEKVEKTIDAGISIRWQEHPDLFFEENLDNDAAREHLIMREREKLKRARDFYSEFKKLETKEEIENIQNYLRHSAELTPPEPIHDLLGYVVRYSAALHSWQRDILSVIRNQSRALSPNARTKMLNEGWATYWHVRIMRKLFEEGFLTKEEHGVFNSFHSGVTRDHKLGFNWYRLGPMLYEYVEERWNKGQFGKEYDECENPIEKVYWDKKAGKGTEKIFSLRSLYNDRMAVEEFFTDEFIWRNKLFIFKREINEQTGDISYVIVERSPETIRQMLKKQFASPLGTQQIVITNSDYHRRGELCLKHHYYGIEFDGLYRDGTLQNLYFLWGKRVFLETVVDKNSVEFEFNGKQIKISK
ncbi:MAG: SpoVR family protein [Patescibacteria group bacterium]